MIHYNPELHYGKVMDYLNMPPKRKMHMDWS